MPSTEITPARISEIRELASKDRTTLERARDIIHGASSNLSDAANRETGRESKRLHAASREYLQVAMDVERMLARLSASLDPSSAPRCQQRWGDGCGGMMLCGYGDAHECGLASLHEGPCVCIACAGSETPFVAEYELATISNFENLLDDSAFKTDFVQVKLDEIDTIVSLVNRLRARSPEADEAGVAQDG